VPSVAIIVVPGVQALDVAGPLDVFSEANRFIGPGRKYDLEILGAVPGVITCSNGMPLAPARHYSEASEAFDLVLAAGGPALPQRAPDAALSTWLRSAAERAGRYGSICNGAFLLAHAGLLDGKTVTTHWNDAASLARRFPKTKVESDRIFMRDDRLYTSAGVTAGIDLSLYLLAQDCGAEVALNVAKRLVVFTQRQGGQSQFSPFLTPIVVEASPVSVVQHYVLAHLTEALTIKRLAALVAMSSRNFARIFARDAQVTPAEFIESARLDAARALLESSDEPMKSVAYRCGFRSTKQMRLVFIKRLGITAMRYRANFAAFRETATVPTHTSS
jgi:transcriptional regulator GlxA family with amidase domain